ncbi:LOW QUALITY PROTEIN: igE-binding protein-like [Phodopus roborovskii]|uniref:LOW QUALITY PROTEIN: igE-binding protein-like n=1 Tax=Phodopus roborovskii TaxID=109678 RepID=UPI0021E3B5C6|nr:LOW QUALITY PROTEIN: igE-binding protein-like [Phodopus roborovskii]
MTGSSSPSGRLFLAQFLQSHIVSIQYWPTAPPLQLRAQQRRRYSLGQGDSARQVVPNPGKLTLTAHGDPSGDWRGFRTVAQRHERTWMFPVFKEDGNRTHHPLEHKQVKELVESVRTYGISTNYTLSQIERLSMVAMTPLDWMLTPLDWMFVVKACLTMGQYLEWKAIWHDLSQSQACANASAGQPAWTFEMLTGQGQWTNNQTVYPLEVYVQINTCAVKAWKALPNRGEVSGNLTKVIQRPNEPFSDFVACMMEAAGRSFGDQEQAMPLIEQLVYEQCTKECRQAITHWKGKGLQAWLNACREIGGPLTNAGLVAAILQGQRKGNMADKNKTCFQCGKMGHIQKNCRECMSGPKRMPGICP